MKKVLLTSTAIALLSAGSMAQSGRLKQNALKTQIPAQVAHENHEHEANKSNYVRCSTISPGDEWDAGFNKLVQHYAEELAAGKSSAANYTIAVVYHIIHNNETVGGANSYNLSQAQINSQTNVLNADYAGTNSDISLVPSTFTAVKAGNCNITFCMALKDPSGNTLTEPGIDRINRSTKGWTAPPYTSGYIDGTIKPNSIWDPTKFLNIWACNLGGGLLGYATFPAASGLTGIPGSLGTATTDGVVLLGSALGNTGFQSTSQYNKGRSGTHEVGHWLGLRHIWGDGNCTATDYCNDTPPAEGSHFGCIAPTPPYHTTNCTGNTTTGEMTMNYMDYTDDACMYMFSNDQRTRMQTCMANGTYRAPLTNNSSTYCSSGTSAPTANFTYPGSICVGSAAQFTDASTGGATSWVWSVNPNTGVTINTSTSQNPTITFPSAATYSVTLTATNSNGSNAITKTVTTVTCAATCDTMNNITPANYPSSIALYYADAVAPRDSGWLSGTNAWGDIAKAEKYSYTNSPKQITAIKSFLYVRGTGNVNFRVWNDNAGKPGTVLATKTVGLGTLVTGWNLITLTTPITPTAVYYVGFSIPSTAGDTIACTTNNASTGGGMAGSGWEQWSDNSWNDYSTVYGADISNYLFPVLCPSIGMSEHTLSGTVDIFPNPSKGLFNVSFNLPFATNINMVVTNTLGQAVYQKNERNVTYNVVPLDLSSLSKGVYFIRITDSNNNHSVKKVVIE